MTQVFPALSGQTFIVKKAPTWSTTVKKAASGRQVRNTLQSYPIWAFKLSYEYLRDKSPSTSQLQNLLAFFNNQQGQFADFYFLDPYDNAVSAQEIAVADGVSVNYQLNRTVGSGSAYPFVEPVYGVNGVPTVSVNGAAAAVTVNAFGVITFAAPPSSGAVLSWSGSFYYLCHFTQDAIEPAQMVSSMWSLEGLEMESVIP